ncbi:MAG: FAD-dependent thymidylate synthase, partial [Candidatus Omnitrophica bacterium]|nr:FAD-dependent thymidylate synthase [Candidatus Omnitrophota bacterium]
MKVYLAGFNVDTAVLKELENISEKRQDLTPEVISAAYARISRDPRPINEIRIEARREVERSRKSNETIIFKMGHHSVAEHAVFNFDILGVSRLAMEEAEKFRLCSYTEKSQRYITLDKDFVIPEELRGVPLEGRFIKMVRLQNEAYSKLFEKLKSYVFKKHEKLAADPKKHNLLEGWAKEDARYITSLATESQVGVTVNARILELMLRRFSSHSLAEVKNLGQSIYEQVSPIAPSIVIFHDANDRDLKTY